MGIGLFSGHKQTQMSALFDIPMTDDEFYMQDGGEPSEYERMVEEKRMERLLKQQIKKYGEDAMRLEPSMAIDSSTMPVEDFQRSYQLRMPGVQHPKKKDKDPLASLLKAMKLGQNTGTKKNRGNEKENNIDGDGTEGGRPAGQPTEELALLAR
jgi:hypothetical protein